MKPVPFFVGLMIFPLVMMTGGCDQDRFQIAEVTGTVTLDGSPLTDTLVIFMPQPVAGNSVVGPFSSGITDENGRFTLKTRYGDPGAVVGPHSISFEYDDIEPLAIQDALSAQKNNGEVRSRADDAAIHNETDTTTTTPDHDIQLADATQQMVISDPEDLRSTGWLKEKLNGRRLIPVRYSLNSNIEFTVPRDGTNSANFVLNTNEMTKNNQVEMGQ